MPRLTAGLLAAALMPFGPGSARAHEEHSHPATPSAEAKRHADSPEAPILQVLADYRAAMEARSVEKLAAVMDPELLVLEGVHKNVGWADYRDNHIRPEMAEWKEFKVSDPKLLEVALDGDLAYAVQEATYSLVMADKTVVLAGAETFVLKKGQSGWKIKHLHFSGKKKEPPPEGAKP